MDNHFMEYNDILNKINEIQAKITDVKETMCTVRGISFDDVPKGTGGGLDIVYFLAEIEELEIELYALEQKKNELRKKHEEEIDKLKNNKHKSILRMAYIHRLDKYKIADTLNISIGYYAQLKGEAKKEFILTILNNSK